MQTLRPGVQSPPTVAGPAHSQLATTQNTGQYKAAPTFNYAGNVNRGQKFIQTDNATPVRTPTDAYGQGKWEQRYGTYIPDFKLPPVRIPGVDVDPNAYAYGGVSQGGWNQQAQEMANRTATGGYFDKGLQMRNQQLQQLQQGAQTRQMYMDAATGNAPSLAQAQLQQGIDRGISAQLAVGNSAHGSAAQRAAAMRGAQLQGGDMMAGLGSQSAALRAQETAAARQGLLTADQSQAQTMAGIRGMDTQTALTNRAQNDAMMQSMYGYGMQSSALEQQGRMQAAAAQNQYDFAAQQGNANLESGYNAADKQLMGQVASGGAGMVAGLAGLMAFSDKRAKHKIEPGEKEVDRFLKTLKPYSYEYKNKAHGEGRKTSVMAQDLEKTSLGETLVSRHSSGLRQVDYAKALPVMLAAVGRLSERIEKAEARK